MNSSTWLGCCPDTRLGTVAAIAPTMTNLTISKLSTTALITRLHTLETRGRFARGEEAMRLHAEWHAVRRELDSRPTDAVLAAL